MRNVVTPVKVGLLVVLAVAAFVVFFSLIREKVSPGNAYEYWALFEDASGLAPKSMVRVAGVEVGKVISIELEDGKARVDFSVRKDIPVYPNAVVAKRSSSILGDYLLDINPGFPLPIAGTDRVTEPLQSGSRIPTVQEAVSMEQVFDTLGEVAGNIQSVTRSVRELIEGETGTIRQIVGNLANVSSTLDTTISRSSMQLDRALADVDVITSQVRTLTTEHQGDFSTIVTNVRVITEQARDVVASIRSIVGEHQGELAEGANGIEGSLANLNRTLANLESITARVEKGEGALGKLISDKELGDKVDAAVTSATDYV
ncbi:MAG TPA: MlaD family protein, partial [Vulgatibacter sp.]